MADTIFMDPETGATQIFDKEEHATRARILVDDAGWEEVTKAQLPDGTIVGLPPILKDLLAEHGFDTVAKMAKATDHQLMRIDGIEQKALKTIRGLKVEKKPTAKTKAPAKK